jgi:IS4 transposase
MNFWQRLVFAAETTAILGPANLIGLLVTTCLTTLWLAFRLLSQGYHRFLFSSK